MKFAIKGTDDDWNKALKGQEVSSSGVVQIESGAFKRKLNQDDIDKEAGVSPKGGSSKKKKKRKSTGKKKK